MHVNVDYDTERDFAANNNIQVYYEGLEDEVVQRVEVGTVSFPPPPSRFLTAAVPTNNFGVNALFEVGPCRSRCSSRPRRAARSPSGSSPSGQATSQPQDRSVRDLDFESGRFYWVVDPTGVPGYPAHRHPEARSPRCRPRPAPGADPGVPLPATLSQRAASTPTSAASPRLARTVGTPAGQTFGPVAMGAADAGRDYYLDPSGLWLALATKLDPTDYLAVSYVTAGGTTVGSFPGHRPGRPGPPTASG